jgi:chromosome segregation ATPase
MEDLLPWFRSFDGVTEDICPSVESLRDCHVFGIIFNQLQDKKIDLATLPRLSASESWMNYRRNIRALVDVTKPIFESHKLSLVLNPTSFARNSDPEALSNLTELFIRLSLKVPRKAEQTARIKSLPKQTQRAIKALFDKTAKPAEVDTDAERKRLLQEQADLEREKQALLAAAPSAALREVELRRAKIAAQGAELDAEIQKREGLAEEKRRLQAEVDALNAKIRELTATLNSAPKTIDDFRGLDDERARKLLADIEEGEKRIRPEFGEALRAENEKLRKTIQALSKEERELGQMVGDMPPVSEGEEERRKEIEALVERNNCLNEETMKLVARAEAIEKLKNQQSFLEHLRASTRFVRPD